MTKGINDKLTEATERYYITDNGYAALPSTENAILTYLSSGSIKGIGNLLASRIVSKYGLDTFDVIENNPLWLCEIKGMTRKKALEISQQFKNQNGIRNVVTFCRDFFGWWSA